MKTYVLNLFILDKDKLVLTGLKNYLDNRFGTGINISTFQDSNSMLKKIETYTNLVILDCDLKDENGNKISNTINKINSKTETVMLSTKEDIAMAIESFQNGASDYKIKRDRSGSKASSLVFKIIFHPIRTIINGFLVSKFRTMF